jgi:hypothetical protein
MDFIKSKKTESNSSNRVPVFMRLYNDYFYVCDMADSSDPEHVAVNELGLTLRARLVRSSGKYAMLEGTIFNPQRLIGAACEINDFKKEEVPGTDGKKGHTLLTVTADGCVNTYMIFDKSLLDSLTSKLALRLVKEQSTNEANA